MSILQTRYLFPLFLLIVGGSSVVHINSALVARYQFVTTSNSRALHMLAEVGYEQSVTKLRFAHPEFFHNTPPFTREVENILKQKQENWKTILQVQPTSEEPLSTLAELSYQLKSPLKAMDYSSRYLKLHPNGDRAEEMKKIQELLRENE